MKNQPKRMAEKPITMYAIGDAKYPFSSLWAIASTLLMRHFLGRQVQEDFFETHSQRPELQEPPSVTDDDGSELASHVASGVAVDFVAAGRTLAVADGDICDA